MTKAKTRYEASQARISAMLENLNAALEEHGHTFEASGARDWGFVGDVAEVEARIRDLTNKLGGGR